MAQYMRLKRTLSVPYAHACLHGFLVSVSPRGTSALSFIILALLRTDIYNVFSKFCQIFFTHIQKGVPSITTVLQGQGVRIAVMPPKGKGKKRVQKKGQDLVEHHSLLPIEVGSVTTAPDGVVHRAQEQHPPSWKNTRENTIDVQLFHPYIYQKFLAKSQRKSHSGGTLHVRLLLLQGTLHVPQACDI